jgi:dihydropteroate synthase
MSFPKPLAGSGPRTLDGWLRSRRSPLLLGILNVTPDSFYDGGRTYQTELAIHRGLELVEEGADALDVGGESTRPGSEPVSLEEEIRRVVPVVEGLARRVKIPISVDTRKAVVARRALNAGAWMINDISALREDPEMARVAVEGQAPIILMHMKGSPKDMQSAPSYADVVAEVRDFLDDRLSVFTEAGGDAAMTLVDPGIGFGKNLEHNLGLLKDLKALKSLGRPLVVGASRKSFLGRLLAREAGLGGEDPMLPPEDRLEGSLAAACWAALNGVDVLRVHDVRATRRALDVFQALFG